MSDVEASAQSTSASSTGADGASVHRAPWRDDENDLEHELSLLEHLQRVVDRKGITSASTLKISLAFNQEELELAHESGATFTSDWATVSEHWFQYAESSGRTADGTRIYDLEVSMVMARMADCQQTFLHNMTVEEQDTNYEMLVR